MQRQQFHRRWSVEWQFLNNLGQERPRRPAGGQCVISRLSGSTAGFMPPGQERRVKGIRQPAAVRAGVAFGPTQAAICSLDVLGVSHEMTARIQHRPRADRNSAENIHVVTTHDHSMPLSSRCGNGADIPSTWPRWSSARSRRLAAQADLALEMSLPCRATGGSHNRTVKPGVARADAEFGPESTDAERWLDTMLHAWSFAGRAKSRTCVVSFLGTGLLCRSTGGPRLAGRGGEGDPERTGAAPVAPSGAPRRREPGRRERLAG